MTNYLQVLPAANDHKQEQQSGDLLLHDVAGTDLGWSLSWSAVTDVVFSCICLKSYFQFSSIKNSAK